MSDGSLDPAALIEHRDFVRSVARGILAQVDAVDEVEQETYRTVLEKPPRGPRSLRAFLGRVARNLSLNHRRDQLRRLSYERDGARAEATPSTVEALERLEWAQRLVAAVATLPSPQRDALVLRYYEGLAPREIAKVQGVPVETVRTRVKTALVSLRTQLEKGGCKEGQWALLVGHSWRVAEGITLSTLKGWSGVAAAGLLGTAGWIAVSCASSAGDGDAAGAPGEERSGGFDGASEAASGGGPSAEGRSRLEAMGYVGGDGSAVEDPEDASASGEAETAVEQLRSLGYLRDEGDEEAEEVEESVQRLKALGYTRETIEEEVVEEIGDPRPPQEADAGVSVPIV